MAGKAVSGRAARAKQRARPVGTLQGDFGMSKIGASRYDYRDPYHLAVSLSWPLFVAAMFGLWLCINLLFASLYVLSPGDVANAAPGSFSDVFFFSVETLATVGYGVMAPATLYGHIMSAAEIVTGTALTAIVTGLLFVRFSRPKAKIIFADWPVVTTHNGQPTLMLRLVNGRTTAMTNAHARLFALLAEHTAEGHSYRRIHDMHLTQAMLPLFIMPWTLMHAINENSPIYGLDQAALARMDAKFFVTVEARDQALATVVQDIKNYDLSSIRFGMRYADSVHISEDGNAIADLSRISLLEAETLQS